MISLKNAVLLGSLALGVACGREETQPVFSRSVSSHSSCYALNDALSLNGGPSGASSDISSENIPSISLLPAPSASLQEREEDEEMDAGLFRDATADFALENEGALSLSWGTLDNNNYPDLFLGQRGGAKIGYNDGSGLRLVDVQEKIICPAEQENLERWVTASWIGDLDGDGDNDILLAEKSQWPATRGGKARLKSLLTQKDRSFLEIILWEMEDTRQDLGGEITGILSLPVTRESKVNAFFYITARDYSENFGDSSLSDFNTHPLRFNRFFLNMVSEEGKFVDITPTVPQEIQIAGNVFTYFAQIIPGVACGADPVFIIANDGAPSYSASLRNINDNTLEFHSLGLENMLTRADGFHSSWYPALMGGSFWFERNDPCIVYAVFSEYGQLPLIKVNLRESTIEELGSATEKDPEAKRAFWCTEVMDANTDGELDIVAVSGERGGGFGNNRGRELSTDRGAGLFLRDSSEELLWSEYTERQEWWMQGDYKNGAAADYNRDGRMDLGAADFMMSQSVKILKNNILPVHHFFGMQISPRLAVDPEATAELVFAEGSSLYLPLSTISGLGGKRDHANAIGISETEGELLKVEIHLRSGERITIENPELNRYYIVH
ncbi:hypothetical protein HYX13_03485 [Candidatus Woesearchaeota archaeon]|nr:hypothetical protein [Candidatus Woesearchaeota archaeon]